VEDTCVCTFTVKSSRDLLLSANVVSAAMKEHIFDPCITRGLYGRWENDELGVWFHHTDQALETPVNSLAGSA
jgi:hypothetical protein